jgi:uncharacterized membrane protein
MEFLQTTEGILILSLVGLLLTCIILYYVIKNAIKDAFKEMDQAKKISPSSEKPLPPPIWNAAQIGLKNRYEKGELTFEEYTTEWNKIS